MFYFSQAKSRANTYQAFQMPAQNFHGSCVEGSLKISVIKMGNHRQKPWIILFFYAVSF